MRHTRIARNIWLGIENLLLHKLRSFLTMLGVVFGVGSVVAMLSVGEGASKEALEQIKKLGSNNIIISSVKSAEEEATSTQHSHMSIYGLTYEDYHRIAESFRNIREVAPKRGREQRCAAGYSVRRNIEQRALRHPCANIDTGDETAVETHSFTSYGQATISSTLNSYI